MPEPHPFLNQLTVFERHLLDFVAHEADTIKEVMREYRLTKNSIHFFIRNVICKALANQIPLDDLEGWFCELLEKDHSGRQ